MTRRTLLAFLSCLPFSWQVKLGSAFGVELTSGQVAPLVWGRASYDGANPKHIFTRHAAKYPPTMAGFDALMGDHAFHAELGQAGYTCDQVDADRVLINGELIDVLVGTPQDAILVPAEHVHDA